MTTSGKTTTESPAPQRNAKSVPSNLAFKAIGLPALAAATRRKPQGRNERRVGLVLDPARYSD
jgi:hypothetical protein